VEGKWKDVRDAAMNNSNRCAVNIGSGRDARKCLRREVSVRGSLRSHLSSVPSSSRDRNGEDVKSSKVNDDVSFPFSARV
jgi:hypothetical protein